MVHKACEQGLVERSLKACKAHGLVVEADKLGRDVEEGAVHVEETGMMLGLHVGTVEADPITCPAGFYRGLVGMPHSGKQQNGIACLERYFGGHVL